VTGIAVNNQQIDLATVTSWADLWRPQYQGKVLLMNDMREVFHMGLRVLGYSGNDTDETHIQQAYQKLTQLIPNVRLFNSDSPKTPFLEGEVAIGMIWNGEAFMAKKENPAISFVYPKEGAILWMDSLVIPQGAKNSNNAHQLIDFLLQPEIAKRISSEIGYATPNQAALNLLDKTIRTNRTAYPTDEDIKNAEFQIDIGSAVTIYEKYWEKLKI
jgi:spermidine/putrescine transport system substrate-binding protein